MKRVLLVTTTLAVGVIAAPAVASAQPSQGDHSIDRNEAGVGGGPHCHLIELELANGQLTYVRVFPSHKGHLASGPGTGPFIADLNCDGLP